MDVGYLGGSNGGRSEFSPARHHCQQAGCDQRFESPLKHRGKRCLHRMQLEQHGPATFKNLADRVSRRKARDIAGPQHQCHTSRRCLRLAALLPRLQKGIEAAGVGTANGCRMPAKNRGVVQRLDRHDVNLDQ